MVIIRSLRGNDEVGVGLQAIGGMCQRVRITADKRPHEGRVVAETRGGRLQSTRPAGGVNQAGSTLDT
jgi:hypothetical protein